MYRKLVVASFKGVYNSRTAFISKSSSQQQFKSLNLVRSFFTTNSRTLQQDEKKIEIKTVTSTDDKPINDNIKSEKSTIKSNENQQNWISQLRKLLKKTNSHDAHSNSSRVNELEIIRQMLAIIVLGGLFFYSLKMGYNLGLVLSFILLALLVA
ncbi:predicted protein [Naegleria gruberi]|uniref:Predicted protein n=1 Tax=Naegleria gruberi TaxID=5762 RepID=D2VEM8_NAEGR|nr:uncharacterized protein NAEGRDRAFT_67331 [Naegleria gruberi]EFC44527.1 predicted protein [Naegleria gruberi]|eukprot:XP_002677271.1 predicted protein [Naegleria gruberi strain NEG-M]